MNMIYNLALDINVTKQIPTEFKNEIAERIFPESLYLSAIVGVDLPIEDVLQVFGSEFVLLMYPTGAGGKYASKYMFGIPTDEKRLEEYAEKYFSHFKGAKRYMVSVSANITHIIE